MAKFHAIGRRKTSVARVYMDEGAGSITVNGKDYKDYFNTAPFALQARAAFHFDRDYWFLRRKS